MIYKFNGGGSEVIDLAEDKVYIYPYNSFHLAVEFYSATTGGTCTLRASISGNGDGKDWAIATDSNGDDIVWTLSAGNRFLDNIGNITFGLKFYLDFSETSGSMDVDVTTK